MTEVPLIALFSVWLALSVLRQFRSPLSSAIARWDLFDWLPHWGLFIVPTRRDFSVLGRARLQDGTTTEWKNVLPVPRSFAWRSVWNPGVTATVVIYSFVNEAARLRDAAGREALARSLRHRALAAFVAGRIVEPRATAIQFIVFGERGHDRDPRRSPIFLSDFHEL